MMPASGKGRSAARTRPTSRPRPGTARSTSGPRIPDHPLGRTGKTHPALGLGLWALGRWTRGDEDRTAATLTRAIARGVRWFDTAEVYGSGRSERLLGDVLARSGALDPPPFLATKISWEHLRPGQVRAALTGSLQRLGRSSVDLYLVHAPDPHVPITATMTALEALWSEGRIGAIGVSNFTLDDLVKARAALQRTEVAAVQVRYNLFDRADGEAVREYCRREGIVVEAYTPIARGLLAGRYLDGTPPSSEVRRFAHDLFEGDRFPELVTRGRALQALALREGVPTASLALHWLERQGASPIVGASRPEQVDELLDAWAAKPSDAALDAAEAITRGVRA
ncbi:MAG: aldo/keto reductase [Thermoplasmata archaeon]